MTPKRDLLAEREEYEERIAICIHDGGLSEKEAYQVADRVLWDKIHGRGAYAKREERDEH